MSIKSTATLLCLSIIILHSILTQANLPLNGDVSFLLQIALHSGSGDIYEKYYEINPPLIIYLYKLFLTPYYLSLLNEVSSIRISMMIYIMSNLAVIYTILKTANIKHKEKIILAIAFCLFYIRPDSFLQREHIIAVGCYTYLFIILSFAIKITPHLVVRIFASIALTISICLKPQYFIIFLFCELYLIKINKYKVSFRLEHLIIFTTGFLYICFVALYHTQYLTEIIPFAKKFYSVFFNDPSIMLLFSVYFIFPSFIAWKYLKGTEINSHLINLIFIYILGGAIAWIISRTGFLYHSILLCGSSLIIVLLSIFISIEKYLDKKTRKNLFEAIYFTLIIFTFKFYDTVNLYKIDYIPSIKYVLSQKPAFNKDADEISQKTYELQQSINNHISDNGKIIFLSTVMYPEATIAINLRQKWASHYPLVWDLPKGISEYNSYINDVKSIRNTITQDLTLNKPEVIVFRNSRILQTNQKTIEIIDFFKIEKEFSSELEKYRPVSFVNYFDIRYSIYKRIEQ